MKLKEIEYYDNIKVFELGKDKILIEIEDSDTTINVSEAVWNDDEEEFEAGSSIGRFQFQELDNGNHYLLWMGLEGCNRKYVHKGIGTEAIKFFKEYYNSKIYSAPNDGIVRDDGSHLTNNAPSFVLKMQSIGLFEPNEDVEDY